MSLIGRLVDKLLKKGSITLIMPDGKRETRGPGGGKHLTVRFTDNKVGFDIVKNPRLGLGETYMNGRLMIEDGTILDLMELITGQNRWEDTANRRNLFAKGRWGQVKRWFQRNKPKRARRNVAHHYDLSDELYDAFLDTDRQYSCAYFTDPRNSLEQAQADKKAHIAAKLAFAARPAGARHRLRLGRDGAVSAPGRGRRRARNHVVGRAAQGRSRARRARPASRTM